MTTKTIAPASNLRWLTTSEVCERLGVSYHTWSKWRQRGCGPRASKPASQSNEIKSGDKVLFYRAKKGFIAHGVFTGPARTPLSKSEAPWAGGVFKFGLIVPFQIAEELKVPQKLTMVNQVFVGTKVGSYTLRRGFSPISDEDGKFILRKTQGK